MIVSCLELLTTCKSRLVFDFEAVLNRNNAVDSFYALLSHLFLEEATNFSAEHNVAVACFASKILLRQVRIVVNYILHSIFQTDDRIAAHDRIVAHWYSAKCDFVHCCLFHDCVAVVLPPKYR